MQRNIAMLIGGGIGIVIGFMLGPIVGLTGSLTLVLALVLGGIGTAAAAVVSSDTKEDVETIGGSSEQMTQLEE